MLSDDLLAMLSGTQKIVIKKTVPSEYFL
jgi:hypothetical protein